MGIAIRLLDPRSCKISISLGYAVVNTDLAALNGAGSGEKIPHSFFSALAIDAVRQAFVTPCTVTTSEARDWI